ncbi:hypothetical protein MP477_20560 [Chryseobacterium sp. WG23]|uniref:hypothetical protein n=1 Tax=Chryseobacterium sp. WG23 TaxID=2926910 RepID=UPI00211E4240|nr:hypothetical protein [Chryseobacterium sp. WG23]MCQ9637348.1 hypothetical protein [Chryseobacterium sp. WG23]
MKKILILTSAILYTLHAFGQVDISSCTPHPSSILTVKATNLKDQYKGILLSSTTTNPINNILT